MRLFAAHGFLEPKLSAADKAAVTQNVFAATRQTRFCSHLSQFSLYFRDLLVHDDLLLVRDAGAGRGGAGGPADDQEVDVMR